MRAIDAGALTINGTAVALGTWVCATLITPTPVDGELTSYGLLAELPAATTTTTPSLTALVAASVRSSSIWPYALPNDMLITSTASLMSPSPFGSSA